MTNLNDAGVGSLRAAVAASVANDSIVFSSGLAGIITLTTGELTVGVNLSLAGPGAGVLTISGNDLSRVFNITAGNFSISGVTIAQAGFGGVGGGIRNAAGATLVVNNCAFINNDAHDGGGIANLGTLAVTNSTFSDNGYDSGGGLLNIGVATVVNCTFADNHSSIGAGIYNNGGTLTLLNCTLTRNASGGSPGGLAQNGTATIGNTIIAGNSFTGFPLLPQDVGSGAVVSLGYNLIGKTNGSTGWIASDLKGSIATPLNPLTGPLQDNGGLVLTVGLLLGSPALDAGNSGGPILDQRGITRPYDNPAVANAAGGNGSDIGAFELAANELPTLVVYNTNNAGAGSLRQTIANVPVYNLAMITFASNVTGRITLASELVVTSSVSILGPGATVLAINGNAATRLFTITNGTVNLSDLTLSNGFHNSFGGGIYNNTFLRVTNCAFAANNAADGGAIYNHTTGTLVVQGAVFSTNLSSSGGALENRGTATLINSTLSGNRGNNGSAIYSSTLGTLTLINCTVVRNGGGTDTYGGLYRFSGSTSIKNSLIALNSNSGFGGPDVTGTIVSQGYNLIGKTNDSSGWVASDLKGSVASPLNPVIGVLQDNGGPTRTVALLAGSPAIDAGSTGGPAFDQRRKPRPYDQSVANASGGNGSDIGAFELNPPTLNILRSPPNVVLLWPSYESGYTLYSATAFANPTVWTPVPGAPVVVGGQYAVTNGPATGNKFYRLQQ